MRRFALLLAVLAAVAASCTSEEPAPPPSSTSSIAPVTTLASTGTSTSTTSTTPPVDESSTTSTAAAPSPENDCAVAEDTSKEGYTQGCTVLGLTVLAGEGVESAAVARQAERVYHMLVERPDLNAALVEARIEGRVIPASERITSLPEYADLYDQYPGTDWARRGRSFPGTELVPYFAGAEENLLCSTEDRYEGEDTFIRVFALTIRRFGLDAVDPGTSAAITQAYGQAIAQGLWTNTLAEINDDEYWMEGAQSYFDANAEDTAEEREPNSTHNAVDTREELRDYDPALYAIAESVFGNTEWRSSCD